ncbi:hypothetical protein HY030_01670 [Candidatus Gottesmanbacteria bacterium]|nr:hypothetical protein [Candidatus Gottesmanbacteria bacterium]
MTNDMFRIITSVLGVDERSVYYFDSGLQHAVWEALDFLIKNNLCGEVPTPRGRRYIIDERTPDGKLVGKRSRFEREIISQDKLRLATAYGVRLKKVGIPLYYSHYTSTGLELEIVKRLGLRPRVVGKHREAIRNFFTQAEESDKLRNRYPRTKTRLDFSSNAFVDYRTSQIMTWHEFSQRLKRILPDFATIVPDNFRNLSSQEIHGGIYNFDIRNRDDGQGIHIYYSTSSGVCRNH